MASRAAAYGEMVLTARVSVRRAVETVIGSTAEFICPSAATLVRIGQLCEHFWSFIYARWTLSQAVGLSGAEGTHRYTRPHGERLASRSPLQRLPPLSSGP